MKRIYIEGQLCIGPHFSKAEFVVIKRNLAKQTGLGTLADSLALAGNAHRLKILYLLFTHKEMCVCDIAYVLDISDSAISQHLRKLKDRNIVSSRRDAQTIYYSLIPNVFTTHLSEMFVMDEAKDHNAFVLEETH